MYHRFGETKYPSTNITEEQLDSHLNFLIEQNYRFIQAGDLLDPNQLNEKTITVTIDDAYLSFYEVGLPIFEKVAEITSCETTSCQCGKLRLVTRR